LLGKVSDTRLSREFKVSKNTVQSERVNRGIRACFKPRNWTDEEIELLGTLPDREVASLTSRSISDVKNKRVLLNIQGYFPGGVPAYFHRQREEKARRVAETTNRLGDTDLPQGGGHRVSQCTVSSFSMNRPGPTPKR